MAPECHQRMADQQDFEIKLVTETFILHPLRRGQENSGCKKVNLSYLLERNPIKVF